VALIDFEVEGAAESDFDGVSNSGGQTLCGTKKSTSTLRGKLDHAQQA